MGSWEDEVDIRRKEGARDGCRVFDCCEILGMEHFSPFFHEVSTQ